MEMQGEQNTLGIIAVAGASSYNLRRTDTATRMATVMSNVGTGPTDITIQGVYQYAGQACNASGCSGWTNAGNTTTVTCTPPPIAGARLQPGVQPDYGCQ